MINQNLWVGGMKQFWNRNHEKIITLLLFSILFIGLVAVIALLGGAVMKMFGFEYKSVGSIILFFLIATVISFPISLIAETLPKVLLAFGKLSKELAILLYIILDTIVTFLGLSTVDYFMESISASDISIVIVALLLSLIGIKDIDQKPKGVN